MAIDNSKKLEMFDEIFIKTDDLRFYKEGLLRLFGWVRCCDNPSCVWLWRKTIRGQSITVSLETAIAMEREISKPESESQPTGGGADETS